MKILHITPHLGGGVGSTILGYLEENKTHQHAVFAFGYTLDWAQKRIDSLGIPFKDHATGKEIIDTIPSFDIVLIHCWNNPLLMGFLVRYGLPKCRVIIWGHVSGFHPPDVYTPKLLKYPDLFVFTSFLSYKLKEVEKLRGEARVNDIWSTGGTQKFRSIEKRKHKGFNVGYIGTVDYAKMHPDFLKMCQKLIKKNIPHLKFIVIGKTKEKELRAEVERLGISEYFKILGWVESLKEYLEIFDVFGYPLNPNHFGTCDLALQEALASGTVPVVFNNEMERTIVKANKTGIVVSNMTKYVQAIVDLYNNVNWRKQLSDNARHDYDKRFSIKRLDDEWNKVFDNVIKFPKTFKQWNIKRCGYVQIPMTGRIIFLESLGDYGEIFVNDDIEKIKKLGKQERWQTTSKGTVHNYLSHFPINPYLKKWSRLMLGKDA